MNDDNSSVNNNRTNNNRPRSRGSQNSSREQGVKNRDSSKPKPIMNPMMNPKLWFAVLFPWFLDLVTPGLFLVTVLGASTWYLIIAITVLQQRSRDKKLQRWSRVFLGLFWVVWLSAWLLNSFGEAILEPGMAEEVFLAESSLQAWLLRLHATLMAGASGLVFLFGAASCAWLFQMRRVSAPSWKRRSEGWTILPSLESLSSVVRNAVVWSFAAWGAGLLLAIFSLSQTQTISFFEALTQDQQVLISSFLWLLLLLALGINRMHAHLSAGRRYSIVLASSLVFWSLLILQAFSRYYSDSFHEPLRWWSR